MISKRKGVYAIMQRIDLVAERVVGDSLRYVLKVMVIGLVLVAATAGLWRWLR